MFHNGQKKAKKTRVFNAQTGWKEIGEKRIYFRSSWEYLYARYLQWQLDNLLISQWQYEPKTFWFDKIKRGVRSYKPDFCVFEKDGTHFWIEVKGFMDSRSKTKIARFKRYYPEEKLLIVDAEWFKKRGIKRGG